ncbi:MULTISPECIES: type II toxin-antitoxin system death-on-curing family toxin [unclassified Rhizobium]|uniref:type II toxin-antitoxin system death-on-curing family toxin n=1 Tax=unclassified Rhizobium TaxID=2613769 RepID=UPI001B31A75D|nr:MULTISPECIES: type II toxin-antitoxin system death-on-curing family toxin [unclassified Rhizobium]MBX5255999.1 type II toxin-antitoxin system death-on-curing family toxin [Rhizobium sp. NLR16b]MBX5262094.1 type II toxin-antitoxin system death-on-curing family toxin [Rhizobium sp. NLR16a]MBX5268404.1 type II toxin-antitoxin system death-on-curing family toxin [Rhizobium sp. NLR17b]MBX5310660.1 type II toxin-antitoxin system death-on-curing family toxin [Rhizobium sp. NLR11b]QTU98311.1 type I
MTTPIWVDVESVITINAQQVFRTGETHFLRDLGALESAVMSPRNHWLYESQDLVRAFGIMLFGIAKAHAFEQGNKRTAFHASAEFLAKNGATLIMPDDEFWASKIEDVVAGSCPLEDFIGVIRVFTVLP